MQAIRMLPSKTSATAAGLLQLCQELHETGLIDQAAMGRIKSAITDELAQDAPRSVTKHAFLADFIRASISA